MLKILPALLFAFLIFSPVSAQEPYVISGLDNTIFSEVTPDGVQPLLFDDLDECEEALASDEFEEFSEHWPDALKRSLKCEPLAAVLSRRNPA